MNQITNAIKEIGSAEANLDQDAAKERIDAQDVTAEELDQHKSSVEVSESAILQKIKTVKDLISQIGENTAETEAAVAQAISEVAGGDQAKMEWLAGELGIDISKLATTGAETFGRDDLKSLAAEVEAGGSDIEKANAAIASILEQFRSLDPRYVGTVDNIANRLNPDVYPLAERLVTVREGVQRIAEHVAAEKEALGSLTGTHKAEAEARISAAEGVVANIERIINEDLIKAFNSSPDAGRDGAPEAAETLETDKANVYAVLSKVLRVDSQEPAAIKAKLLEGLKGADNIGQFLDQLMSSIKSIEGVPGLTDGTAEALIARTGLDVAVAALKSEFGDNKLTPEQAEQVADKLMGAAAEIQSNQEQAKPFEITPLTTDQLASRATNVASFPGVAGSPTETLQASKVEQALTLALEKAIESKDLEGLKQLGAALGIVINETDVDKVINHVKENRDAINERIKALSQAVDGKNQAEIQAAAAEANRQNVDALLSAAAKEFPEHVGTQRWHNWVNKLASGETQKSFAEYLAEDEPVQGLEAIFLMIKKFIMQFKDLMAGINPKEGEQTLSQKLQEEVDKAKELINSAYLKRLADEFGVPADQVEGLSEGISFYNENKDIIEAHPEINIKELNVDGQGEVSKADKIKFLQSLSESDREEFVAVLRSTEERPYMQNVIEAGLAIETVQKIYNFSEAMGSKLSEIKFEDGKLVVNGQSAELKAGNDLVIQDFLTVFLEDDDGTVDTTVIEESAANAQAIERLVGSVRFTEGLEQSDFPDDLHENEDLFKAIVSFGTTTNEPITKDDLALIKDKASVFAEYSFQKEVDANYGTFVAEDGTETSYSWFGQRFTWFTEDISVNYTEDGFEVNGTGGGLNADLKFANKRAFINWLKKQ